MTHRYPFQKLSYVRQHQDEQEILLAASGPSILSISPHNGHVVRQWPSPSDDESSDGETGDPDARPAKRRKIDAGHDSDASQDSIEIVAERKKGERKRTKIIDPKLPNVSHIIATKDGQHVIAVTADDKSIKVFRLKPSGRLILLNERSLPKRLCALRLTADESTLLAADKFGDVYSLPLHPSKDYVPKIPLTESEIPFSPAATELTVHTKGNREALKQQLELRKLKPRKEGPSFEHQLLLGHVSLLTDLLVGRGDVAGRERAFILTADRDEHIRVSRGIPQAHIIETYCLGHRDFISKLCIPTWAPDVLVAGNGEPSLRMFRWQSGEQLEATEILPMVPQELLAELELDGRSKEKLVVSGLWTLDQDTVYGDCQAPRHIFVAIEGLPLLLVFTMTQDLHLQHVDTIRTDGNVLDLSQIAADKIIISIDTAHKPASVKALRSSVIEMISPLHIYSINRSLNQGSENGPDESSTTPLWQKAIFPNADIVLEHLSKIENEQANGEIRGRGYEKLYSDLGEFLYGLENLRKKMNFTAEDEVAEAEDIIS